MRAAVLRAPRAIGVEAVEAPRPGPGEVLVRVRAAGICGTDYRVFTGERPVRYPLVPGHEFIGDIAAAGQGVTRVALGERVAVEPNWGCGACDLCRDGNGNLCLARTAVGLDRAGGFAELVTLPERACWTAPAGLSDDQLLLTEPLAVVVRAVARAAPRPGETAAVVGAGTLGLLALQVLRSEGCRVLVVSRSARRLDLARDLGAAAVVALDADDAGPARAAAAARALSGRDGADLAVETAGTAAAVELTLGADLVRPGGRVVLTGLPHEPASVSFFWLVRREIDVRGSMIYQREFGAALALLARGAIEVGPLLTHRFPLGEIGVALEAHRRPDAIKVAVVPGAGPA
jgi:2-desacetyl-2-hydroxyethyl bacteriochlorophyllide A dehydrogenase